MIRRTLPALVLLLAGGCTVLVEDTLQSRDAGADTGPEGPRCGSSADCLIIPDRIIDCTQVCVGASPGTLGVCVSDHPDLTPAGTPCGDADGARICVAGECLERGCGDGYVDREATPPEYCDDGDRVDTNSCNNGCSRSCVPPAPANCSDGDACNGAEMCDGASGTCLGSAPVADGTACTTQAAAPGMCTGGTCIASE